MTAHNEHDKHRQQQQTYVICVNLQSGNFIIMFHLSCHSLRHAQFNFFASTNMRLQCADYAQPKTENEK